MCVHVCVFAESNSPLPQVSATMGYSLPDALRRAESEQGGRNGVEQMLAGQETGDVCLEVKREARMNGLLPAASSP